MCVLFASCVTFCFVACHAPVSVDYVTYSAFDCHALWFVCIQKCFYCRSTASGKDNGACVQCCAGKCAVSFHVTCFVLAGFAMEPSDWPQPTETYCERHQRTRFKVSSLCETCNKQFSTKEGCKIDWERGHFSFSGLSRASKLLGKLSRITRGY